MGQGLDDRFTRIHPTMNPPVPRSNTRSVFPGVTGGSSLDDLRSQHRWNQGYPTNFPSGEGLVPQSHTEESQFQNYVTQSQRDRLTWPGDPSPWPAGDSEGPASPRPTAAPMDQGIGSLAGTASAPSGIARTPDWLAQNIPALGSLPSLVYTDPNTGQTVDMRPTQSMDLSYSTESVNGIGTIGYTPYDMYDWGNSFATASGDSLSSEGFFDPSDGSTDWRFNTGNMYESTSNPGTWLDETQRYFPGSIPSEPDLNRFGRPMWQWQNTSSGGIQSARPY